MASTSSNSTYDDEEDYSDDISEFSEEQPAQEWFDGNGALHRDGDLPAYIQMDLDEGTETREWYQHGKLHRDGDLPATITKKVQEGREGTFLSSVPIGHYLLKEWYKYGKLHREGLKPAFISNEGHSAEYKKWYRHGIEISKEEIEKEKKERAKSLFTLKNINLPDDMKYEIMKTLHGDKVWKPKRGGSRTKKGKNHVKNPLKSVKKRHTKKPTKKPTKKRHTKKPTKKRHTKKHKLRT
jgi:hypothetical protein